YLFAISPRSESSVAFRCARSLSSFAPGSPPSCSALSLHDALPISAPPLTPSAAAPSARGAGRPCAAPGRRGPGWAPRSREGSGRSEEHTSELQSRFDLVCRLLLEKKN